MGVGVCGSARAVMLQNWLSASDYRLPIYGHILRAFLALIEAITGLCCGNAELLLFFFNPNPGLLSNLSSLSHFN